VPNGAATSVHSSSFPNDIYLKKIKSLETQLTNSKIFLNMVIHDLRNPTNSIQYALGQVLKTLTEKKPLLANLTLNQSFEPNNSMPQLGTL
jgi:signal transduction histidine kinase